MQKVVDELLGNGAIEPSTGSAYTLGCLWFLCMLVVYGPCLILSSLISIYSYLLFRCLLSDRYGNACGKVIMFLSLIFWIVIYIFLLLCVVIEFCCLCGSVNFINGMFYHLVWLQPLGFSIHFLTPFVSLLGQGVSYYTFGWYFSLDILYTCRHEGMILFVLHWSSSWVTH